MVWLNKIFGGVTLAAKPKPRLAMRTALPDPAMDGTEATGAAHALPDAPDKVPLPAAPPPLVSSAQRSDIASRSQLTQQLSDICLASGKNLSPREHDLFFDILRRLLHRIEMQVRKSIAERLAGRADTPHDIIVQLANDKIEVAYPVLAESTVLKDADLIELILNKARAHQKAITKRAEISAAVSEALVSTNDEDVVRGLLENQGAEIMPETMARLADQSLETEAYCAPLLRRSDLDPALAQRMYTWVGEALRSYIDQHYEWEEDAVDEAMSLAIAEAVETDWLDESNVVNFEEYAGSAQYEQNDTLLIHALADADIYRFEETFRFLTDLSSSAVTRLLYDSGPEALATAFKAIGVDRKSFSEIFCHLRGSRPYEAFVRSPAHEKAMAYFDRLSEDEAEQMMESWRRSTDVDLPSRQPAAQ